MKQSVNVREKINRSGIFLSGFFMHVGLHISVVRFFR